MGGTDHRGPSRRGPCDRDRRRGDRHFHCDQDARVPFRTGSQRPPAGGRPGPGRLHDSAGLAALVGTAKHGGSLYAVCARPRTRQLFRLTGLDCRIPLAGTEDEPYKPWRPHGHTLKHHSRAPPTRWPGFSVPAAPRVSRTAGRVSGVHHRSRRTEGRVRFWERNGSGGSRQARSEAVARPGCTPLTCENIIQQRLCRPACSVRIEGVRGSSPLSSTRGYRQNCRCRTEPNCGGERCL